MKVIKLIMLVVIWFFMNSCDDKKILNAPIYTVNIYYKNSKGENLLDPGTVGHYNKNDINVNGSDFSIDSARYHSPLPKGYALSFVLSGGYSTGTFNFIITLNSATTDTLVSKFSGTVLKSCTYNRVNVLPANLSTPDFPVVIVK